MSQHAIIERRSKPRIEGSIPAAVTVMDESGGSYEIGTVLGNLSVSGLYVRLDRPAALASPFLATIRFAGLEVKAKGTVRRVESHPDGTFGLGVAFDSYRLIPAEAAETC